MTALDLVMGICLFWELCTSFCFWLFRITRNLENDLAQLHRFDFAALGVEGAVGFKGTVAVKVVFGIHWGEE